MEATATSEGALRLARSLSLSRSLLVRSGCLSWALLMCAPLSLSLLLSILSSRRKVVFTTVVRHGPRSAASDDGQ